MGGEIDVSGENQEGGDEREAEACHADEFDEYSHLARDSQLGILHLPLKPLAQDHVKQRRDEPPRQAEEEDFDSQ